jgi:hypothetical protein
MFLKYIVSFNSLIIVFCFEEKEKKQIICGCKKYVLTDLAEHSIMKLILTMRDQFSDASEADLRSSTLSFLCLAKIGDVLDKNLSVCVNLLNYLSEDNLW